MSTWILLLPIAVPLALMPGLLHRRTRELALRCAPWAALPSLGVALLPPAGQLTVPDALLGATLALDPIGRAFLGLLGVIWLAAGLHASAYPGCRQRQARYWGFHLATLAGNAGLTVAQDVVTFQACFALMGFAAYGLVIHDGTDDSRRAGRIYLALALVGEFLVLAGAMLGSLAASSGQLQAVSEAVGTGPLGRPALILLTVGFGIKAGLVPLHVWLPLAHPAAPAPASAVLSGVLVKAGLFGWLRYLPLGVVAVPDWGGVFVAAGLGSTAFALVVGVTQSNPKAVLAYSTISQMGLLAVAVGAGLLSPAAWPVLVTLIAVAMVHHGLAKATLFLGAGLAPYSSGRGRWILGAVLVGTAASLAGAPWTMGAMAKSALKLSVQTLPGGWHTLGGWLLPLAAVGTTTLMARSLLLMAREPRHIAPSRVGGMWAGTCGLGLVVMLGGLWLPAWFPEVGGLGSAAPGAALWPIVVGLGLTGAAVWLVRHGHHSGFRPLPPGDVLVMLEWVGVGTAERFRRWRRNRLRRGRRAAVARFDQGAWLLTRATQAETALLEWRVSGVLLLFVLLAVAILVVRW